MEIQMKRKWIEVSSAVLVDEADVTSEMLKQIIDGVHHECNLMPDGSLVVSGTDLPRPLWITINPDRKHITFWICDREPPCESTELLAMVNTFNETAEMLQFHVANGYLQGEYTLTYVGGLNVKQFVVLMRKISRLYEAAITNRNEVWAPS
jgi:hypothetical protein